MKTFKIFCEDCKQDTGNTSIFDDCYSDDHCKERTEKGYLCQTCADARATASPQESAEQLRAELMSILERLNALEGQ